MMYARRLPHVVVAGGGVAALETCLALRAVGGDRVRVTLIAPNRHFVHRPVSVRDPLTIDGLAGVPLADLARSAGAELRRDRVASVDPARACVRTETGLELSYDALVVAIGAMPLAVPAGAQLFDDEHTAGGHVLIHRLRRGAFTSLAFVEPPAPACALDLYELALQTAVTTRREGVVAAELTLVTAQPGPLAILGRPAASALYATLRAHGVQVVSSAYVRSIGDGAVELAPGSRRIAADRVIAVPRLAGPRLAGLPCDGDGFLPADPYGRVRGVAGVYAAGGCTSFPVKHPSLAAEQAVAAASAITADAGLPVEASPFEPVLRGILPSRLRWYVEAPLSGGLGDATRVSSHPPWSPDVRFGARFLTPYLEQHTAEGFHPTAGTASAPTHERTAAIVAA